MKHKFTLAALTAGALMMGAPAMADTVYLTVSGQTYEVDLLDNEFTADLKAQLPVTLVFENFKENERIAKLPQSIGPGEYTQSYDVKRSDVAYFVPWGVFCVFRVDYHTPQNLAPLGKISNEATIAIENSGSSEVLLSAEPPAQ